MTRAILWKEIREQAAILIALFVMGAGLVVGVAMLNPPTHGVGGAIDFRELSEAPRALLLAIVLVAGMVVGATLFAGEEELRTASYLYSLPVRRARLFVAKVTTGLILTAVIVLGLIAVGRAVGLFGGKETVLWVAGLGMAGLSAFCAGVAGSTLARTTLVACGLAVVFGQVWSIVGILPGLLARAVAARVLEWRDDSPDLATLPAVAMPLFVIPAALLQGFLQFTAPDRRRKLAHVGTSAVAEAKQAVRMINVPHVRIGFRRLFWITRRQLTKPALILGGVALVVGLILCHPDASPALVWPVATLAFGALTGVIAFADEQTNGARQFWSERQLPAGRVWLAKTCGACAVTFGLMILLLLPRAIALAINDADPVRPDSLFNSAVLPALKWSFFYYLVLGPIYGVAFGVACGMLFQKPVVAAATAMLLAGVTAVLWMPSLFSGGLHYWQILLPPLAVLVTGRRLVRPWVNERVGTRRGIRTLVIGSVATLLLLAGGIGYRVVEIEDAPEGEADVAFAKTIPTYDDKQPGRDLKAAAARFGESLRRRTEMPERILGKVDRILYVGPDGQPRQNYAVQLWVATEIGWPDDRPDLDRWLDKLCSGDWIEPAIALRGRPAGVFEDPNEMTFATWYKASEDARYLTSALIARGLQLQARGDDAAFVAYADASLAAVRTGRNKTTELAAMMARNWGTPVYTGLDHWLAKLDGKPELLRELLVALRQHDAAPPYDPAEAHMAQQVIVRNSFKAPQQWAHNLPGYEENGWGLRVNEKVRRAEADWLAFAWIVPWEKERLRRLIGRGNATVPNVTPIQRAVYAVETLFNSATPPPGSVLTDRDLGEGLPGSTMVEMMAGLRGGRSTAGEIYATAEVRMAILKVALRLYQHEQGKLPETLGELVPKYLPAVPLDPFDGKPIRYRVSAGEVIYGREREPDGTPGRDLICNLNRLQFAAVAAVAGGGVLWPTADDPVSPPGRDAEVQLEPEQFDAVAAVAGAIVRWPDGAADIPGGPAFGAPGGFFGGPGGPGGPVGSAGWGDDEYHALAAVAGGAVFEPLNFEPFVPPGRGVEELTEVQFDAVAAVAGAAVQWPLDPVWKDAPAAARVRIPRHVARSREEIEVPAGQAILWCVGPDMVDDQGLFQAIGRQDTGDVVRLVPPPPKPRRKEQGR
jgi:hypothetical protein